MGTAPSSPKRCVVGARCAVALQGVQGGSGRPVAGQSRGASVAAALTGEWGGELDNGRLSAEGIISTRLAAIVVLVAVQHRHLVRPAEGQARGCLAWGWGHCLAKPTCCCGQGARSKLGYHTDPPARAPFAQVVRPNSAPALWPPVLAPHLEERLMGFLDTHHPHPHPHFCSDLRGGGLISAPGFYLNTKR